MIINLIDAKEAQAEFEPNADFVEEALDELTYENMAMLFNDEKILEKILDKRESVWNRKMIGELNENGRKHIKRLYDMVCQWYKENPQDAEEEGYTEL